MGVDICCDLVVTVPQLLLDDLHRQASRNHRARRMVPFEAEMHILLC